MGSRLLLLNWDGHKSNVISEFQQLFSRSELTDVTLACEGFSLQAHKTVLSASSSFFRNMFLHHPCKHAFVILTDVDSEGLKAIVDFIYQGQIYIPQEKFTQFLTIAEKLKIKGLSTIAQNEKYKSLEELMMNIGCSGESTTHDDSSLEMETRCSPTLCQENRSQPAELGINSRVVFNSSATHKKSYDSTSTSNVNCRGEAFRHINISSETPPNSLSDDSIVISRNQPAELSIDIEEVSNSFPSYKTIKVEPSDNESTVCRDESLMNIDTSEKQPATSNVNCKGEAFRHINISSETLPNSLSDDSTVISRNQPAELSLDIEVSNSFPSYKTIKVEPSNNEPTVCRDESLMHIHTSERQPAALCSDASFQINGPQQTEFNLSPTEMPLSSVTDYKTIKDDPSNSVSSIYEDNSICELEQDFSSSSVYNTLTNSTGVVPNQPLVTPVQSMLKETAQCLFQMYPTSNNESSATSMIETENLANSITTANELNKTRNSMYSRKTVSNQIIESQTSIQSRIESCDKIVTNSSFSKCIICKKKFSEGSLLITHQRSHIEEGHLCCGICSKIFKWKKGLKVHMMIHSGEQPYSCGFCGRKFSRKENMIIHRRIHTGEKPHSCNYCEKRFSDKTSLIYHLRKYHQENLLLCYICKKNFTNNYNLKIHLGGHFTRNEYLLKQ